MERRTHRQDRRRMTLRGVSGYDRRKRNRRASRDDALTFTPAAPREHTEPEADDLDFTIPKQKE